MRGQGFNFGGKKAQALKARLRAIKLNPKAARRLLGLRDKPKVEGKAK